MNSSNPYYSDGYYLGKKRTKSQNISPSLNNIIKNILKKNNYNQNIIDHQKYVIFYCKDKFFYSILEKDNKYFLNFNQSGKKLDSKNLKLLTPFKNVYMSGSYVSDNNNNTYLITDINNDNELTLYNINTTETINNQDINNYKIINTLKSYNLLLIGYYKHNNELYYRHTDYLYKVKIIDNLFTVPDGNPVMKNDYDDFVSVYNYDNYIFFSEDFNHENLKRNEYNKVLSNFYINDKIKINNNIYKIYNIIDDICICINPDESSIKYEFNINSVTKINITLEDKKYYVLNNERYYYYNNNKLFEVNKQIDRYAICLSEIDDYNMIRFTKNYDFKLCDELSFYSFYNIRTLVKDKKKHYWSC